jgi:hypothetical protein
MTKFLFSAIAAATASFLVSASADEKVDFNRQIRPILSDNCFACHGPDEHDRKADLRLDTFEGATADHDGVKAVDVADPAASELLARILSDDRDEIMPPPKSHKSLSADQKALLKRWIEEGAQWADHWAFEVPKKSAAADSIDGFVRKRMAAKKLSLSPEADRATLIRRVTFDLTGLPPTWQEVDAFVKDQRPDAFERVVDRLISSKAYGERMALNWMDLARYGDSSVMHADGPRQMWPWRDWVISAYNDNKAFNNFTIEQIAGDLLPNATTEQKIATGFNRNHASSDEGGAIAEELRVEYIVDRVMTTSNVFLGLSMECAQCHDHKYDPVSQTDYYRMFAYFNNNADPGMQTRKGNQAPVVKFFSAEQEQELAAAKASAAAAEKNLAARRVEGLKGFGAWHDQMVVASSKGESGAVVARSNLVHHFPLDEKSGTELHDEVSGRKAKFQGKLATAKRDDSEAGVKLDNSNHALLTDPGVIEFDQALTFSTWVKVPKKAANGAILARMDVGANYRGYDLWLQGNRIGTHLIHSWPDNAVKVVSAAPLKPDEWHHVCVTYDGSGKAAGVSVWVDGKKVKTTTEQDDLTATITPKVPLKIGGRSNSQATTCDIDDLRIYRQALSEVEVQALGKNPIDALLAIAPDKRTKDQVKKLEEFYLRSEDREYQQLTKARDKVLAAVQKIETAQLSSMIMGDNDPKQMRVTYVLNRGSYDSPDKERPVEPGVPAVLPPLPENAPPTRLGLAQWLTQPEHPLTARVAVNRYWTMLFGEGLVRTVADFGSQGTPPTHPQLLDWLAVDFVESGWDVKRMMKQIVMSQTYRQSSRLTPALAEADPENQLLARGPRFRLAGEFIRDQALAASGLLVEKIGGPSVKPYQPPGLWNEVSLSGNVKFVQDKGENLYRRSLYTYWKRSAPQPAMIAFDAPSREKCTVQRQETNTPLQALVTLNDPQFVEAARQLAERMMKEGGDSIRDRIDFGYGVLLGRAATDSEAAVLEKILKAEQRAFQADGEKAKAFLSVGESPRDESLDLTEHAAWAVIANLMLNLDEVLTRG